jgi:AcrR family transcriptional regulator
MRVTAQAKAATREKILREARRLFAESGFEATTTRDIAREAGIASGTLFNYFATKEAIVAALAGDAVAGASATPPAYEGQTLEEDLFALVAAGLRKLKPLRRHLPALLETSLGPLAVAADEDSTSLRVGHLEAVLDLAARHGLGELPATALQLYWTLYTGVLAFWANDKSPKQEDTLALMDDSIEMFVGWIRAQVQTQKE